MLTSLRSILVCLFGLMLSMLGFSAHAAGPDLTTLTDSIDFSTTSTAILAVAAALMVVYIVWKAAGMVLQAVKRL